MDPIFRVQKATSAEEMKYRLRVVKHYSSFNSCAELGEFLRDIVSENLTFPNFTVGKTKCLYLIKFGIAPWIRQKLINQTPTSPYFNVSLDNSHNSVLEMD